jgi:hypothetical protein
VAHDLAFSYFEGMFWRLRQVRRIIERTAEAP